MSICKPRFANVIAFVGTWIKQVSTGGPIALHRGFGWRTNLQGHRYPAACDNLGCVRFELKGPI